MTKARYRSKQKYKESLYSNLLVGSILSECAENEIILHPKLVAKDDSDMDFISVPHLQTFVMRWNPEISSHKVADFEHAMEGFYNEGFYYDWSIFDHEKVRIGDRFFMLKVGSGNTGIVMSGTIASLPFKDEDWSGKGRDVLYVRMIPDCMIHPDMSELISIQTLDQTLPGVNWNEGHSGVLLSDVQAYKFNELWHDYFSRK